MHKNSTIGATEIKPLLTKVFLKQAYTYVHMHIPTHVYIYT